MWPLWALAEASRGLREAMLRRVAVEITEKKRFIESFKA
jgi:hypothetical protein